MSQHVDKVLVTVSGSDSVMSGVSVTRFELDVAVNAIPTIVLDILPIDSLFALLDSGKYVTATAAKFSDLTDLYSQLYKKAVEGETTATIKIDIKNGDSSGTDSVTLKDWVLTDATLSSVTNYSAPSLRITFKHPIVALDRSGEVYEIPFVLDYHRSLRDVVSSAEDMVTLMDLVYGYFSRNIYCELINSGDDYAELQDSAKTIKKFRENLGKQEYLPSTYLECKCNLFLEKNVSDVNGELIPYWKGVLGDFVAPFFGAGSTWMTIISKVCPACLMQVIPRYDSKKLLLEPCSPWKKAEYSIPENKVEVMDMVPVDPSPLCGVAVYAKNYHYSYNTDINTMHIPNEFKDHPVASKYSFYIPKDLRGKDNKYGHIELLGDNTIIEKLINQDYTYAQTDVNSSIVSGCHRQVRLGLYHIFAKGAYECLYRRQCITTITTTAMFRAEKGGPIIYPGRVITVKEKSLNGGKGGDILYGYLSRMVITGSTSGGCMSTYELSYTRSVDSNSPIAEGTLNPCYQADS